VEGVGDVALGAAGGGRGHEGGSKKELAEHGCESKWDEEETSEMNTSR
jgi:hypothetical protein